MGVEESVDMSMCRCDEPVAGRLFPPGSSARDEVCSELPEPTAAVVLESGATRARAAGLLLAERRRRARAGPEAGS
jgi:hypothetical protein